ncbi:hypothetical protein ACOMHN_002483 [Nucella lapillus]
MGKRGWGGDRDLMAKGPLWERGVGWGQRSEGRYGKEGEGTEIRGPLWERGGGDRDLRAKGPLWERGGGDRDPRAAMGKRGRGQRSDGRYGKEGVGTEI